MEVSSRESEYNNMDIKEQFYPRVFPGYTVENLGG